MPWIWSAGGYCDWILRWIHMLLIRGPAHFVATWCAAAWIAQHVTCYGCAPLKAPYHCYPVTKPVRGYHVVSGALLQFVVIVPAVC